MDAKEMAFTPCKGILIGIFLFVNQLFTNSYPDTESMKSRLFVKLLLVMLATSSAVVILMVLGMQFLIYHNFTDYVLQQDLDRLDGLVGALADEYRSADNWERFRNNPRKWHDMVARYVPVREPAQPPPPENEIPGETVPLKKQSVPRNAEVRPEDQNLPKRDYRSRFQSWDRPPMPAPHRPVPEVAALARRLSLFDESRQLIFGNPIQSEQVFRQIKTGGRIIGWLGLQKDRQMMSPTDISFLREQSRAFYAIGVIVFILAVLVSVVFSGHLTAPIKKMALATRAIRNRRFDTRITIASNDELGQLAEDFNAMVQTLQNFENIRRQWLTDIAHELRTPLAVLRGEIEALQDGIRQMNPQAVDSLHAEVMVLSNIVDDLSLIAKTDSGIIEMKPVPVDPVQVLRTSIERFKVRFEDRRLVLRERISNDGRKTMGDADKMTQVFGNIFENIVRYASSPGTVWVSAEAENNHFKIMVEDTGPGVPEASLPRLFDRLYRTDAARSRETGGSGLGLSICKTIIDAHGGSIRAENSASGGLRIVIELPFNEP